MTVIPAPTWSLALVHYLSDAYRKGLTFEGVFGMARTTIVDDGTHDFNCDMVTPAQIDIRSLPSSASDIPSSARINLTILGFELNISWYSRSIAM